ncbi:MAG: right-handed parallel beta-helix repeat-containing protein, partial [Thermomicrobiales bacterium]
AAAPPEATAKRRRRKAAAEHNVRGAKAIMCIEGVTTRVSKKRRKRYLKQGATRGECATPTTSTTPAPVCVPTCPAEGCGAANGCGGTCGCPSGSVCNAGVCDACTVTCTGTPAECGATLATAMYSGGTVLVCPGTYAGNFLPPTLGLTMTLIGAGNGADPATNTIITQTADTRAIFTFSVAGQTLSFRNVRITGGNYSGGAGAMTIVHATISVALIDSVITGNAGLYGGLYLNQGSLSLTGCEVTTNTASSDGGGIRTFGPLTLTDTLVSGNTSGANGGGIYVSGSTTTLAANVTITGNTATGANSGGGVYVNGGTFNRNGATISGNTPDDCQGAGC